MHIQPHQAARAQCQTSAYSLQKCCYVNRRSSFICKSATSDEILQVAHRAAGLASDAILEAVDKPRSIKNKIGTDIVTDTDTLCEQLITKAISSAFPEHGILGEEGGVYGNSSSNYLWVIDPLDGTVNFAHGYPSFAVSVGCVVRGEPVAGVVVEFGGGPGNWTSRTYSACVGQGATCNGETMSVSQTNKLEESLLVTDFGGEQDAVHGEGLSIFRTFARGTQGVRRNGSSAVGLCHVVAGAADGMCGYGPIRDDVWEAGMTLFDVATQKGQGARRLGAGAVDLCHVACGMSESYWEYRLKPWDVAAASLILTEAGGKLTCMDGQPWSIFSRSMLATNGHIHDDMLAITKPSTDKLVQQGHDLSPWLCPPGYPPPLSA